MSGDGRSPIPEDKLLAYIYDDVDDSDIFALENIDSGHNENDAKNEPAIETNEIVGENENLKEMVKELQAKKEILELRISEIYKTARAEIDRKDRRLRELNEEKNNILFRRIRAAPKYEPTKVQPEKDLNNEPRMVTNAKKFQVIRDNAILDISVNEVKPQYNKSSRSNKVQQCNDVRNSKSGILKKTTNESDKNSKHNQKLSSTDKVEDKVKDKIEDIAPKTNHFKTQESNIRRRKSDSLDPIEKESYNFQLSSKDKKVTEKSLENIHLQPDKSRPRDKFEERQKWPPKAPSGSPPREYLQPNPERQPLSQDRSPHSHMVQQYNDVRNPKSEVLNETTNENDKNSRYYEKLSSADKVKDKIGDIAPATKAQESNIRRRKSVSLDIDKESYDVQIRGRDIKPTEKAYNSPLENVYLQPDKSRPKDKFEERQEWLPITPSGSPPREYLQTNPEIRPLYQDRSPHSHKVQQYNDARSSKSDVLNRNTNESGKNSKHNEKHSSIDKVKDKIEDVAPITNQFKAQESNIRRRKSVNLDIDKESYNFQMTGTDKKPTEKAYNNSPLENIYVETDRSRPKNIFEERQKWPPRAPSGSPPREYLQPNPERRPPSQDRSPDSHKDQQYNDVRNSKPEVLNKNTNENYKNSRHNERLTATDEVKHKIEDIAPATKTQESNIRRRKSVSLDIDKESYNFQMSSRDKKPTEEAYNSPLENIYLETNKSRPKDIFEERQKYPPRAPSGSPPREYLQPNPERRPLSQDRCHDFNGKRSRPKSNTSYGTHKGPRTPSVSPPRKDLQHVSRTRSKSGRRNYHERRRNTSEENIRKDVKSSPNKAKLTRPPKTLSCSPEGENLTEDSRKQSYSLSKEKHKESKCLEGPTKKSYKKSHSTSLERAVGNKNTKKGGDNESRNSRSKNSSTNKDKYVESGDTSRKRNRNEHNLNNYKNNPRGSRSLPNEKDQRRGGLKVKSRFKDRYGNNCPGRNTNRRYDWNKRNNRNDETRFGQDSAKRNRARIRSRDYSYKSRCTFSNTNKRSDPASYRPKNISNLKERILRYSMERVPKDLRQAIFRNRENKEQSKRRGNDTDYSDLDDLRLHLSGGSDETSSIDGNKKERQLYDDRDEEFQLVKHLGSSVVEMSDEALEKILEEKLKQLYAETVHSERSRPVERNDQLTDVEEGQLTDIEEGQLTKRGEVHYPLQVNREDVRIFSSSKVDTEIHQEINTEHSIQHEEKLIIEDQTILSRSSRHVPTIQPFKNQDVNEEIFFEQNNETIQGGIVTIDQGDNQFKTVFQARQHIKRLNKTKSKIVDTVIISDTQQNTETSDTQKIEFNICETATANPHKQKEKDYDYFELRDRGQTDIKAMLTDLIIPGIENENWQELAKLGGIILHKNDPAMLHTDNKNSSNLNEAVAANRNKKKIDFNEYKDRKKAEINLVEGNVELKTLDSKNEQTTGDVKLAENIETNNTYNIVPENNSEHSNIIINENIASHHVFENIEVENNESKEAGSFLHDFSMSEDEDPDGTLSHPITPSVEVTVPPILPMKEKKINVLDVIIIKPSGLTVAQNFQQSFPQTQKVLEENVSESCDLKNQANSQEPLECIERIQEAVNSNIIVEKSVPNRYHEEHTLDREELQKCLEDDTSATKQNLEVHDETLVESPENILDSKDTKKPVKRKIIKKDKVEVNENESKLQEKMLALFGSITPSPRRPFLSDASKKSKENAEQVQKVKRNILVEVKSTKARNKPERKPKKKALLSKSADGTPLKNTLTKEAAVVGETSNKHQSTTSETYDIPTYYPQFANNPNYIPNPQSEQAFESSNQYINKKILEYKKAQKREEKETDEKLQTDATKDKNILESPKVKKAKKIEKSKLKNVTQTSKGSILKLSEGSEPEKKKKLQKALLKIKMFPTSTRKRKELPSCSENNQNNKKKRVLHSVSDSGSDGLDVSDKMIKDDKKSTNTKRNNNTEKKTTKKISDSSKNSLLNSDLKLKIEDLAQKKSEKIGYSKNSKKSKRSQPKKCDSPKIDDTSQEIKSNSKQYKVKSIKAESVLGKTKKRKQVDNNCHTISTESKQNDTLPDKIPPKGKSPRRITPMKVGEISPSKKESFQNEKATLVSSKRKLSDSNEGSRPEKIQKLAGDVAPNQSPLPHIEQMLKHLESKANDCEGQSHVHNNMDALSIIEHNNSECAKIPAVDPNRQDQSFTDSLHQINLDTKDVSLLGSFQRGILENMSEYLLDKSLPLLEGGDKVKCNQEESSSPSAKESVNPIDFSNFLNKNTDTSTPVKKSNVFNGNRAVSLRVSEASGVQSQLVSSSNLSNNKVSPGKSPNQGDSFLKRYFVAPLKRDRRKKVLIIMMDAP